MTADERRRMRDRVARSDPSHAASARAEARRQGKPDVDIVGDLREWDARRDSFPPRLYGERVAAVVVGSMVHQMRREGYAVVSFRCFLSRDPEHGEQRFRVSLWGPRGDEIGGQSGVSNVEIMRRTARHGVQTMVEWLVVPALREAKKHLPAEWLRAPEELAIMERHPAWRRA